MPPDFDATRVRDGSISIVIGKRSTGKTHLALDLVSGRGIPYGVVTNATEAANQEYTPLMPSGLVHDEYSASVLEGFMKRQKEAVRRARPANDLRGFVVLDNCIFDARWTKDAAIRELFIHNRHHKSTVVMTMSFAMAMPPILRYNVDFVFVFRDGNIQNRKRVWEQYGVADTFEAFDAAFRECTEDPWSCLVIDCATQTLHKYKAPSERVATPLCAGDLSSPSRSRL